MFCKAFLKIFMLSTVLLFLLLAGIGVALSWFCYRKKKRRKTVTITTEEVETLEEEKSEKRFSESSMNRFQRGVCKTFSYI